MRWRLSALEALVDCHGPLVLISDEGFCIFQAWGVTSLFISSLVLESFYSKVLVLVLRVF
jgi:hypothetical protein